MMECLERYSGLMTAFFTLCLAIITLFLAIIAYRQLSRFTNQVRADFLYRVSRDLDAWLREHKPARDWIFNKLDGEELGRDRFNEWEFDDFLGFFETIWTFDKKKLVDKEIVYDLFSDYLIAVYEANDYELRKIIEELRKEEKKYDLYIGAERLYEEMKNMERIQKRRRSQRSEDDKEIYSFFG